MSLSRCSMLLVLATATCLADEPVEKPAKPTRLELWIRRKTEPGFLEFEAHAELMRTYAEFTRLRADGADEKAWEAFEKEHGSRMDVVADRLEEYASARRPALQRYLWASRDYLLPMVAGHRRSRLGPNEDESKFLQHVAAATPYFIDQMEERDRLLKQMQKSEDK